MSKVDINKIFHKNGKVKIDLQNLIMNEKLLLMKYKIILIIILDFEENDLFTEYINRFYDHCDSLKYKKGSRKVKFKYLKHEACINMWNDVFLYTDKLSNNNYGILLASNNHDGTCTFFENLSSIHSTYVVKLPGKLSPENIGNLRLLNENFNKFSNDNDEILIRDLLFAVTDLEILNNQNEKFSPNHYKEYIWKETCKTKLLNFKINMTNNFKSVNCIIQNPNDYQFELFINGLNLDNFTENVKDFMKCLEELDEKWQIFNYLKVIDDNLSHKKSTSSAYTSKQFTDNRNSSENIKKLNTFELSTDEDTDDETGDIEEKDVARACIAATETAEEIFDYPMIKNKRPKKLNFFNKCPNSLNERKKERVKSIFDLPEDIFIKLSEYLTNIDKMNLIFASKGFINVFQDSRTILKKLEISINKNNIDQFLDHRFLNCVPFINLTFDLQNIQTFNKFLTFISKFKESIEKLVVKNAEFTGYIDFLNFFGFIPNLKKIYLDKCKIGAVSNEILPPYIFLESIYFNKCNENVFKVFQYQPSICQFTIRNDDWTWIGFPHEIFNIMAKNARNLNKIILIGSGTGSFFDSDEFPFKVKVLDTTMISFHWYVGIRNGRVNFLKTQRENLKELIIHQLPFDFDGGKVLNFIFEEMNLDKFYYGKIPLILEGKKQEIKEFEVNEIQLTSMYEMFKQFPLTSSLRLNISTTDIASDEIERLLSPPTKLFDNLENFEVDDNSKYRGTLGIFLSLFKNMKNLRKLSLKTQDRNINTLLGEFLQYMPKLEEIYLTSKAPRATERLQIIKANVRFICKLSVAPEYVDEARKIFGSGVNVSSVSESN